MKDTLERIQRLREHGKRMARIDLAQAENERSTQRHLLDELEQRMDDARSNVDCENADDMARYHTYRMRMEIVGRKQEQVLVDADQSVEDKRSAVNIAAREAEVVSTMLDRRRELKRTVDERRDRQVRDEVSMHAWMRKAQ